MPPPFSSPIRTSPYTRESSGGHRAMPAGIVLAVVVGVLIVLALIAGLTTSNRKPTSLPVINPVGLQRGQRRTSESVESDVDAEMTNGRNRRVSAWHRATNALMSPQMRGFRRPYGSVQRERPAPALSGVTTSAGGRDVSPFKQNGTPHGGDSAGPDEDLNSPSAAEENSEYFRAHEGTPLDWLTTAEQEAESEAPSPDASAAGRPPPPLDLLGAITSTDGDDADERQPAALVSVSPV